MGLLDFDFRSLDRRHVSRFESFCVIFDVEKILIFVILDVL